MIKVQVYIKHTIYQKLHKSNRKDLVSFLICYFSYHSWIDAFEDPSLTTPFSTKMRGEETQPQEHQHTCPFYKSSVTPPLPSIKTMKKPRLIRKFKRARHLHWSRAVPHPDVFWYRLNGMGDQKKCAQKVLSTLFSYIFHIKTKWKIVYEYLKTKIFSSDTNILPQMHWIPNIFRHSATTIWGFGVSVNYPILNFKKKVCQKNVWMRHWRALYFPHTNAQNSHYLIY